MPARSSKQDIKQRATWAIVSYSIFRLESALTIAITVLLIFLYPAPFPWWKWWYWLVLGAVGEVLIIYTSIVDETTAQRVVADMFQQRFDPNGIRQTKYRDSLQRALEYRRRIETTIRGQHSEVLKGYLESAMTQVTDWIANIYRLAKRLDEYEGDSVIQRDTLALPKQIQHAEAKLRLEDSEQVRQELRQMIASKRVQVQNLTDLENAMQKAELQMENSLTALGTLYSQLLLLDAKEVDSGRARNISQSIQDQVSALQNVVSALDEVYKRTA
ncbi:MAG: hypothetical protein GXY76_11400 [Chloroflexi bacterium]|nr:hypothetical protein [Chloroflexota bacterium]